MTDLEQPSSPLQRIAVCLEYDGAAFSGWQKQLSPLLATIQQEVESALSQVADHPVDVVCAGRTDAGVHATCQVIHFDCAIDRGEKAWTMGCNSLLARSIRILSATPVANDFHARFSATARRYLYVMFQRKIAPAILYRRVTHIADELDVGAMQDAAHYLLGEQDFTSFRAAGCQSRSPNRNVMEANVYRQGAFIVLDIQANAFLQHMVRNIVGALLQVGRGERDSAWIAELLQAKDRTLAGVTAPPDGLYLVEVGYPDRFGLPVRFARPSFMDLGE